jgi:hypothetical protein
VGQWGLWDFTAEEYPKVVLKMARLSLAKSVFHLSSTRRINVPEIPQVPATNEFL